MANDVKFEGKERRMAKIEKCLAEYGLSSLEEARDLCLSKGIDVDAIVKGVQPIAFENASWAYTLGAAVAIKSGVKQLPKPLKRSASVFRRSAFPAPLRSRETLVSATETLVRVFFPKKRSVSHSLRATRALRQLKALSALPARQTKCAKSPFV